LQDLFSGFIDRDLMPYIGKQRTVIMPIKAAAMALSLSLIDLTQKHLQMGRRQVIHKRKSDGYND
jgi:hypothetical protein